MAMPERFGSRHAIAEHQLRQLNDLLGAILPANRFYARKLGGSPRKLQSLDAFQSGVPFTTKQELVDDQIANAPYGTNLSFPIERYTRFHQTSGTTSAPLRWLDTPESWEWMLGNWDEIFAASGVTGRDRIFFAFSFGPFIGFWLAFEAALRMGALCLPGGGMSSPARVRTIVENGATVLCCTPTYALRLAEAVERAELRRLKVKRILVAGEPGGSIAATRGRIEEAWPGAVVCDHHGMTEVGPVTYQCPERPGVLHVLERSYVAEVIDPKSGGAVNSGETGELVLTTLGRIGSPLLRYRTGDLVEPVACACGRPELALDGGILGRVDDMVIVRGVNVYPSAVEQVIADCGGVAEYEVRVKQKGNLTELAVVIEPEPACADASALARQLGSAFQAAFGLRVAVTLAPIGTLPRQEMKARRWIKEK